MKMELLTVGTLIKELEKTPKGLHVYWYKEKMYDVVMKVTEQKQLAEHSYDGHCVVLRGLESGPL